MGGEPVAIIQKPIRLVGSKGSQEELAIFDSGSTYSCIQPELAESRWISAQRRKGKL